MERLVKGDIVVFQFPFLDTNESKKRPALVAANTTDENLILCQITSQERPDPDTTPITQKDFQQGTLKRDSFIRPTILFSVHKSRIDYKAGKLKQEKIKIIEEKFCEIFTR
ncbi:MAG: type II toxin-antitoxin system PemK/MazF family toxin [Nanoarchaeota archaeon]|nr:type II toxin-antitoxin system PemK/MazF family toxin [Nanoarchaeota archaeon]MBU1269177.1 type II toxin-antitoxin system PemK/MazF family toxin [Nanoarchaeota archaeon]MBU1603955.1 type II toxin-antitoxin system PemK/MazF family toxin [Nanoarchaeota archaeon]MBU2442633.1 type II toxin-antitoxin system PemK/MazF family toxin [Nanoarchaeota archaeon]